MHRETPGRYQGSPEPDFDQLFAPYPQRGLPLTKGAVY